MLFVDTELCEKSIPLSLSLSCQYHSHSGQYRSSNSAQCRTGDNGYSASGCGPATRKHCSAASCRLAPRSVQNDSERGRGLFRGRDRQSLLKEETGVCGSESPSSFPSHSTRSRHETVWIHRGVWASVSPSQRDSSGARR
jgi:hypothetical protein